MLRVREVAGPPAADVGDGVTYRATTFSEPSPRAADLAQVSWLIRSADGAALASVHRQGPVLQLTIPDSWAGQTAIVMPYVNSPTARVCVRTTVSALAPRPREAGSVRAVDIIREQNRFYASVDEDPRFYLGTRVSYRDRRGLMNSSNPPGPRYRAEDYEAAHGDWAWYLLPTMTCESLGHFTCLNTYDRAAFTFGHMQLAAHTPDDNFVSFFRELLEQPAAAEYFPDLTISNGRIHRRTGTGTLAALESAGSTAKLMQYFNATPDEVDETEAARAARMVDWCLRYPPARDLQVEFAIRQQRRKLKRHATRLPLDTLADGLCLVVLDILHQGRGSYARITAALRAADPFDALLGIGTPQYAGRVAALHAAIRDLEVRGKVGQKVYDSTAGDFIAPVGA